MSDFLPASSPSQPLDQEMLTPEYFIEHFFEILPRYISKGRPSEDTLATYREGIILFLKWCKENKRHPLTVHDYQMRLYLSYLYNMNYKDSTISLRIVAVRTFFYIAMKLNFIKENPCDDIHISNQFKNDEDFYYFNEEQIRKIYNIFSNESDDFTRTRNTLILFLMAVEGLRNIEVHRLNDEDINLETRSIYIRGKGRNAYIYPCDDTINLIKEYMKLRPAVKKDGILTPTIISNSNYNKSGRLHRNGIRYIVNKLLEACHLKHLGYSCHIFRHSCGTNLYQQTKDLRIVQETLRHKDPKMAARYAHVHDRMTNRYTESLSPFSSKKS